VELHEGIAQVLLEGQAVAHYGGINRREPVNAADWQCGMLDGRRLNAALDRR
jgi:hypothetical protein